MRDRAPHLAGLLCLLALTACRRDDDGTDRYRCSSNADCPPSRSCVQSTCELPAPALDARADDPIESDRLDASPDLGADRSGDAGTDRPGDTAPAVPDAAVDRSPDLARDVPLDEGPERTPDAAGDALDAAVDRSPDLARDVAIDEAPERTPDAAVDASPDAGPEAPLSMGADAGADDVAPDAVSSAEPMCLGVCTGGPSQSPALARICPNGSSGSDLDAMRALAAANGYTCQRGAAISGFGIEIEGACVRARRYYCPPEVADVAVSASPGHVCAIHADHTASCWGSNIWGESRVPAGRHWKAISAGTNHTCGLQMDGTIVCWGHSDQQLAPSGIFKALGRAHNVPCAIRTDDTVACWGAPAGFEAPPAGAFLSVTGDDEVVCGLRSPGGGVTCWGPPGWRLGVQNQHLVAPTGDGFTQLELGTWMACGLRRGEAICWGRSSFIYGSDLQQIALVDRDESLVSVICGADSTGAVSCMSTDSNRQVLPPPDMPYATLSASMFQMCGLGVNGVTECWRPSQSIEAPAVPRRPLLNLQLGISAGCGILTNEKIAACWPVVEALPLTPFTFSYEAPSAVALGPAGAACAVMGNATLSCRPDNVGAPGGTYLGLAFTAGAYCALRTDHGVDCATGSSGPPTYSPPGLFSQIAGEENRLCGVHLDGTLACWKNDGTTAGWTVPTGTFVEVAVGSAHACARRQDRTVVCWGTNTHGEATAPSGAFESLSAGVGISCGVRADGTLACWGNLTGELASRIPPGKVRAVSAFDRTICALDDAGYLTCWGNYVFEAAAWKL
jgi:hypothetical protein